MKSTANDFSAPRGRKTGDCRALLAILLLAGFAVGCATSSWREARETRFQSARQLTPLPEIEIVVSDLEADLARTSFGDVERRSLTRMSQLADIFYQRLSHRRVNSISTFHDPALREFFHSEEAFADYYADLVQALDLEHFRANRPQQIDLLSLHVEKGADRVVVIVAFRGDNALPLRFWSVDYSRRDVWEYSDDRWWIIPGKL
jgi:hypothetical protein